MKIKILELFCCSLLLAACSREPAQGGGYLTVNLDALGQTKSILGATAGEMQVNSLNLYVFDTDGMLDLSHACTDAEINAKQAVMPVKTGTKQVFALANFQGTPLEAANAAATRSELVQVPFSLEDNHAGGLLMTASASTTVTPGSGGSAILELTRPVARVALGSVTNNLPAPYGTVRVLRAFLCNVVGNQNVGGDAAPSLWYNRNATDDNQAANHVVGTSGHPADAAAWTYVEVNQDVARGATHTFTEKFFYAFPNALINPNNGFSTTFTPTATVLMIVVSIRNIPYYYPVPLIHTLEANKDYKVDLTLIGLGNTGDAPFNKIEKASLSASVSISDWTSGATYTESI